MQLSIKNRFKKLSLIILSSLLFINSLTLPLTALAAPFNPPPATPAGSTSSTTTSTSSWYNQGFASWLIKLFI